MALDIHQILTDSLNASKEIAGQAWKDVKPFAEHESKQFAEDVEFLVQLKADGIIDDEEFKARFSFLKLGFTNVFLAIKGIGILQAQNIVNAIIGIVSQSVLSAFNIALPV
jgi:hypothetical protein